MLKITWDDQTCTGTWLEDDYNGEVHKLVDTFKLNDYKSCVLKTDAEELYLLQCKAFEGGLAPHYHVGVSYEALLPIAHAFLRWRGDGDEILKRFSKAIAACEDSIEFFDEEARCGVTLSFWMDVPK